VIQVSWVGCGFQSYSFGILNLTSGFSEIFMKFSDIQLLIERC